MTNRLQIITDALMNTGNNPVNVEYDGSVEWQVADPGYRRALNFLIPRHTWNFANTTVNLAGLLPSSPHPIYDKAYQLPNDCMIVETAWLNSHPLSEYEILDQKFCCRYDTGVLIKYVRAPAPDQWPPLFVELLTIKLGEYLLRGLNEDTDNARKRAADVEGLLEEVRSAQDRQEPPRALFRSRTAARRRGRGSRSSLVS